MAWIDRAESGDGCVITSRLSRLECRVGPLRDGTLPAALFETFAALLVA